MSRSASPVYHRFPDEISGRLSYGENHPERERFYATLRDARCEGNDLRELQDIVTFIQEEVEPGKQYPDEPIRYLGLEDIEQNTGKAKPRSCLGRDIRSTSKRLPKGTIVFAGLRPYLNKVHLIEEEGIIGSTELFVVHQNSENVTSQFLLKYLLSDLVLAQTKWVLTGSSYPRLDGGDFKKIRVVLPLNKDSQVAILDSVKPFEQEAERKNARVEQLKEECRNVILNTLKIATLSPATFNPSIPYFISWPNQNPERLDLIYHHPWMDELRKLLSSLKTMKLGDIIEPHIDYGITAAGKEEGDCPFINIENLRPDGRLITSNIRYIDSVEDANVVHAKDILLSRSRLVGVCSIVTENEEGFSFGSYILRMKVRKESKIPPEYVVSFLNSDLGRAQIRLQETGGFGKNINTRQLKDIDIVLPTEDSNIDNLVTRITAKWAELTDLEEQAQVAWAVSHRKFISLLISNSVLDF